MHLPIKSIAIAFGSTEESVLLKGGQGTAYRSGNIVVKPADGVEQSNWLADIFSRLPKSDNVRLAAPVRAITGEWIYEGFVAWTFLEGEHVNGDYEKKIDASLTFHNLIKNIEQPPFLESRKDSWAIADRAVWNAQEFDYDEEFLALIHQIAPKLKPLNLLSQLIHGDMSGNFLSHKTLSPALIDFSPAWAPNGFGEGIMLADAIAWENADLNSLEVFKKLPHIDQFAWRGTLRRILEQAEHIKYWGKSKESAVIDALEFQKTIDYLKENFS
ncbi:MAG: hypothetical protein HY433_00350 [Candidatus Liptonbacteria bacterium]|nr:hypothetical protein [Candidatus Liptonbacteria bacterium]